ncbi:MAG TPA: tRNA(Ile)(2)-agmatinylcytidine synthase [Thermoplasmata archaeon]|nr:tRNA(Ile)(2)-agmatinylcytidine synthase [Thermoplasmata archaeon]
MGPIWIGIDDTDSPHGGCTTWVLTELLDEAGSCGVDLIGEPRLVRLNPNIPWKTRGNAALAARFGAGRGRRRQVGELAGRPVWSYERAGPLSPDVRDRWSERAWERVLRSSRDDPGTDPVLIVTERTLPAELYWNAVRDVVEPSTVLERLRREGATVRTRGDPRGAVGAAAAVAWPGVRRTWELIAYREPERVGRKREVDASSVRAASRRHPDLFLCDDPRTRRLLVAPHTPCPILFGLRGTRPQAPLAARREVRSEPVDRWLLFRTNQGTGDHLVPRAASALTEFLSAIVTGSVRELPRVDRGGHVQFTIIDRDGGPLRCVAFEPTKTLPRVARSLRPGDDVRVWGSHGRDRTLRLEGIEILRTAGRHEPPRPPRCSTCRIAASSLGQGRGYRCARCRRRWPPEAAVARPRAPEFSRGVYHPTPSARRHLAPLGPEP